MEFAVLVDHRVKIKESEKTGKYLDLVRELKKTKTQQKTKPKKKVEHEGNGDTNCSWGA